LRHRLIAILCIAVFAAACAPNAPSPTTAPAKSEAPTASKSAASPAAAPAGSPAASPGPAASPAAGGPAAAQPAVHTSEPLAKLPDFPTKPIEIIVPYPPGGGFDSLSRQITNPLQRQLGQPVVVKNVPGGGSRIGARQFQQAPADGHTIVYVGDTNLYTSTLVEPAEGFDMQTWVWVAGIRRSPGVVSTGKDSAFKTAQDVVNAGRSGQRIRLPNNGLGGYLGSQVLLATALGIENAVHVGGFGGPGDMAPSLIRLETDISLGTPITSWTGFFQTGDLRPLFVPQPDRNPLIPDVATARELNLPNLQDLEVLGTSTYGFAVGPGTPPERVQLLQDATFRAMQDPEFIAWAKESGTTEDLQPLPGAEFKSRKAAEYGTYLKYVDQIKKAIS
jgi:tripartite-type tricarboxylate transporter receptor subunit TctC